MEVEQLNGAGTVLAAPEVQSLASPFAEATTEAAAEVAPGSAETWLSSPFAEAFAGPGDRESAVLEALASELEDLAFEEGIQRLVDEAAARHLSATASWSSEAEAASLADRELEGWFNALAGETDRLLAYLESEFETREPHSIGEGELEAAAASYLAEHPAEHLAGEQFLGGLIRKAGKLIKGVAGAVTRLLPVGRLFGLLRRLVGPLLKRVLRTAINRLPNQLRGPASLLAKKLLGESETVTEAEVVAAEFDARLAEAVVAGNEAETERVLGELEAEAEAPLDRYDAAGELDDARARLAEHLASATPGDSPVTEVEQFVPVVMAALPLVRLGIQAVGRDKVVGFLGDRLADLIKGHIGPEAARALGRPLADVGLRLLSLEAESGGGEARLGAEALVATLEDTIREVASLPAESLAEPLRLEAELQQSFNEAAARHVPRAALRADLPDHEAERATGIWVFMPRRTRPRYRYKKYTHVFRVPITRPVARAVILTDGGTLERRLLDAGAREWPLEAEVHLYESVPGTQLGHLAAFETQEGPASAAFAADEFDELTPEIAGLLTGEPGLGRRRMVSPAASGWRPAPPGTRMFRIVVPGLRVRRRQRFVVRMSAGAGGPTLRVHLRLSEREAHVVSGLFAQRAYVRVVALIRDILGPGAQHVLAERLARHAQRAFQLTLPTARRMQLAGEVAEAMMTQIAKELPAMGALLEKAAADPAPGITLTFSFRFADVTAVGAGTPGVPTLSIRPGLHRD